MEGSKKGKEKKETQTLYATSASEIKTSTTDEALERNAYIVSASPKANLTKAQSESTLTKAKPTSYADVLSYSLANSGSSTANSRLTHSSSASEERPRSSSIIHNTSSASYASSSEEIRTQSSDDLKKTPYIASQEFIGKKTTPYNSNALSSSSSKSSLDNLYIRDSDVKALKKAVQNTFKVITHGSGSDESTEAVTLSSHRV